MSVRLIAPVVEDFAYLARRMRPDEIAQWSALTGIREYCPDLAVRGFLALQGVAYGLIDDASGLPLVIGGLELVRPGVYQTWMLGSMEGWGQHWRAITKASRRIVDDTLSTGVAQRVQTFALASRTQAHRWYEKGLGQTFEGTHRRFFADGQDAVCYARTVDDLGGTDGRQQ